MRVSKWLLSLPAVFSVMFFVAGCSDDPKDDSPKFRNEWVNEYFSDRITINRWYDEDGNFTHEEIYEYDSYRMISHKLYRVDGNLIISEQVFEYDSDGKLTNSTYWLVYFYDTNGKLATEHKSYFLRVDDDGMLGFNPGYVKTYDADGNLTSKKENEYDSDGDWINTKYYDGDGNLLSCEGDC